MPDNSVRIIENTTHSNNDSSLEIIVSDKYKGNGYYGSADGKHTIQYSVADFSGDINIQATLVLDPTDDDWFTVSSDTIVDVTTSKIFNFSGNYVWVRAVVEYTDGTVNSLMLNY